VKDSSRPAIDHRTRTVIALMNAAMAQAGVRAEAASKEEAAAEDERHRDE
jgi:hypothetical protein